ncbi:MAG: SpoIIIAH-like family protein [Corallococcus sp.]|nr:SpoIIIAH-like family protein [Corallococcus sp.]
MRKGKKIILLVSMVLVLAVAAVLNVTLLTQKDGDGSNGGTTTVGSFFTTSKADRQSTRDYEIAQLNEILAMEGDEYAAARKSALEQKQKLVNAMDTEMLIETLLKAQGFDEVLVSVGSTNSNVNVIVGKDQLERQDTARIYDIISREASITPDYVKILAI